MRKPAEIRDMTPEELDRAIEEDRKELFALRLQSQTGQLENSARIRLLRKEVARLETEKTARRIKAQ
ncbi:MAG: 50S ribosomal protein L29 [Oligosphaeraceae bacterium]